MEQSADVGSLEPKNGSEEEAGGESVKSPIETQQRLILWILPALALCTSFVLAHTHLPGPPCYFRAALHLPCPGCGLTRSFNAIWHGNLITSFRFHPLGLPLFAIFAIYVLAVAFQSRVPLAQSVSRRLTLAFNEARIWKVATCLLTGVWVARLCLIFAGNRYFLW